MLPRTLSHKNAVSQVNSYLATLFPCSIFLDSLLQGLQRILLAKLRLFACSGTDKSMCIPDNNIHLQYSYVVASVLGGFVSYPVILCQFRGLQEPAVLFTGDIVTQLTRSRGGFITTCEPANGYLPVPGPTSLCTYLAILITCGTVILLTESWGGYWKTCQLAKGCLQGPGSVSTWQYCSLAIQLPSSLGLGGAIGKLVSLLKVVCQFRDQQVPAILITQNIVIVLLGPVEALGNLLRQKYDQQCTRSSYFIAVLALPTLQSSLFLTVQQYSLLTLSNYIAVLALPITQYSPFLTIQQYSSTSSSSLPYYIAVLVLPQDTEYDKHTLDMSPQAQVEACL